MSEQFFRHELEVKTCNFRTLTLAATSSKKRAGNPKRKLTDSQNVESFKQEIKTEDHLLSTENILHKYNTNREKGLTNEIAKRLHNEKGPNKLVTSKGKSYLAIWIECTFCGFAAILWVACCCCVVNFCICMFILDVNEDKESDMWDQLYLGICMAVVIVVTSMFGFYHEVVNLTVMKSFGEMAPKSANVLREGAMKSIRAEELVVGDIVDINSGDCIPADLRLISCNGLKVDNSAITGESEAQARGLENTDPNPLEAQNLVFCGTYAVEGRGMGVVIAIGSDTFMGHIALLTTGLKSAETQMRKELKRFIKWITIIAVSIGVVVGTIAICLGTQPFEGILYAIAIVIALVPEGLLVTLTAALTLTGKKMARKNCMVKNLQAIETLGATSVICSDKTGTLTQNEMTVSHMYYDGSIFDVLSDNFEVFQSDGFKELIRVGMLCSRAEFIEAKKSAGKLPTERLVTGDASERAVLKCMEKLHGNVEDFRNEHLKIHEVPFNSTNKYQLSIHKLPNSDRLLLVMKGAPERILDRCDTMSSGAATSDMDQITKKRLKRVLLEISSMGERVLGFADLVLPEDYTDAHTFEQDNFPDTGLRFVGFMSMIDPPRPGVSDAVDKCKRAGIKVIMVTGDHPVTAMTIARKVGIISPGNDTAYDIAMRRNFSQLSDLDLEADDKCKAKVVTGTELRTMESVDLDLLISTYQEIVFARTSPQQKLQIVEAFQRSGYIVAVTGDGINDSPALKRADIGIAMGISGSEVSKEAADMILLDDNFATIVHGIEEGRLIFDNLKKSIAYMLTSNVPELLPFLMYILVGLPKSLSIMAIFLIDVGTDVWPGISLAYEKAEADIMQKPPRDPANDRLVSFKLVMFAVLNIGVIQAVSSLTCYFYLMSHYGFKYTELLFVKERWESPDDGLLDSLGNEWSKKERKVLEMKGCAAFFLSIVITQLADCVICKTRRLSIFQQGMGNWVMNGGMFFAIAMGLFFTYTPNVNETFKLSSIPAECIFPAIGYSILIIVFDESRKYVIRKYPTGFFARETYF